VGLRAVLEGCGKFHLHRDSIPGLSSPKTVTFPTTKYFALPGTILVINKMIRWAGRMGYMGKWAMQINNFFVKVTGRDDFGSCALRGGRCNVRIYF
jgi:hypothetical protein